MSTILNVDDRDDQRHLVSLVLRRAGFEVEEAGSGEEALRLARHGPSLVLLDINLPDIDGFEVCRRIKEDPETSSIPVVHLTAAYPQSVHWARGLERGADGYLVHPVDPLVLVATVRALLRSREAESALRREVENRRRAEEARRESEERWRSLVTNAPDIILTVDRDHRIRFANRTVPGMTVEEVMGRSVYDYVPPTHAELVREKLDHTLSTGEPTHYETVGSGPHGGTAWYSARLGPVERDGEVIAATMIVTDITQRREAEERLRALNEELETRVAARTRELRESDERYRSAVAALQEGIMVLDGDARMVACNASAERILGLPAAEILGRTAFDPRWRVVADDGTPIPASARPAVVALTTGRAVTNALLGVEKPDGTVSWLLLSAQPLREEGEGRPRGVVVSFTDMTDRRRVRQRVDAQHAVTRILSDAPSFPEAAPRLLAAIGEALDMDVGEVWCADAGDGFLRRRWEWHRPRMAGTEFVERSGELARRSGEGMPGRAWERGRAEWTADVALGRGLVRREWALRAGLHGALAFPVRASRGVETVFAFFSCWQLPPDDETVAALDALGTQVGDFIGRKEAEQALLESERRLRAIFEQTPVAIAMSGLDGRFLKVNEAFCRMLGYTAEEMCARTFLDVTHPDDVATSAACLRSHLEGRVPSMVREKRYLTKAGRVVWARVTTSLVRDESEEPRYFVGIIENITQRRRAEALASAQAGLLEMIARGTALADVLTAIVALLEEQSDGLLGSILLLDEDGRLRRGAAPHLPESFNRAVDGLVIGPRAGSCGTAAFTGRPVIVADVTVDPSWEDYRPLAAAQGIRACWSTPIRSRTGDVLGTFALYAREPRTPGDHEWRLIEVATQVASIALDRARAEEALGKSEARYRTLFENSKDAIFIVGRKRRLIDANEAAVELFGGSRDELMKMDAREAFVSEVERHWFIKQMEAMGSVRDFEARLRKKDGTEMDCLITASVRRDARGRLVAHEGIIRDVTAQKAADWANRELSRHLLQVQDDERRRIARELHDSTAQHLAALGMHLAVLEGSKALDPRAVRAVAECHALLQQCSKEVRTLSYVLHPPLLDEVGLAAALRWLAEGFAARSGIAAALEMSPDVGRLPRDAELALFRIVQEALTNVHRHSGSSTATIRVERSAEGVTLEVEDSGRGMPDRVADGASLDLRGLGVGILGMRERVRQLGGELEILAEGGGTLVRAVLPARAQ